MMQIKSHLLPNTNKEGGGERLLKRTTCPSWPCRGTKNKIWGLSSTTPSQKELSGSGSVRTAKTQSPNQGKETLKNQGKWEQAAAKEVTKQRAGWILQTTRTVWGELSSVWARVFRDDWGPFKEAELNELGTRNSASHAGWFFSRQQQVPVCVWLEMVTTQS